MSDSIDLRTVEARSEGAYRPFLTASLLLATLVGFVLGIHVPVTRLLDTGRPERTADLVQAHGQVQLLGFAGLYVMGMSLRLLPRFTSARLAFEGLLPVVLWSLVASLIARAVLMPWFYGTAHDALLLASAAGVLIAAGGFLLIVAATLLANARRGDASGAAFLIGALLLMLAAESNLLAVIDGLSGGLRSLPYLADNAVTQLELMGFVLVAIIGVSLRAMPVMMGLDRPLRGARLLPAGLAITVLLVAGSLLYQQYIASSELLNSVCDLGLIGMGLALLAFVWQAGTLRPAANRIRPASQPHLWLIRSAFIWLIVAAGLALYTGASRLVDAQLPSPSQFDAIRHSVGVGVVTSLILGMSLMILPEFAVERQRLNHQRLIAMTLATMINVAAILRVAPAVAADHWSLDARNASMAIAGSLAEAALILFAVALLRIMLRQRPIR